MAHILILMSDTGGGHRAVAEAIQQAIRRLDDGGRFTIEMVDFIKETVIPPWHHIGRIYKPVVERASWLWDLTFKVTSPRVLRKGFIAVNGALVAPKMWRLLRKHRADLVVSVHPLATSVPGHILRHLRPEVPFVTVVTDLVTGHPFWFWKKAHTIFVPSEEARQRALKARVPNDNIEVTGLPIDLRFAELTALTDINKAEIKQQYGMPPDRSMVLLIGGGEGMGHLEEYAHAIAASPAFGGRLGANLPLSLMVITGRNEKLRHHLSKQEWAIPTQITGFVRDMPRRMAAADLLITKAGPSTLCEGLAAGLPILITGFIPGQEEGNVHWITESGAGRLTPTSSQILHALHDLIDHNGPTPLYHQARQVAQRLARPNAALTVAQRLMEMADKAMMRQAKSALMWHS